jgi:hypothetical protein
LGKIWKEAVVAYLKAAHQNLAEGIEENYTNLIKETESEDWIRSRYLQNMKQNSETILGCSVIYVISCLFNDGVATAEVICCSNY